MVASAAGIKKVLPLVVIFMFSQNHEILTPSKSTRYFYCFHSPSRDHVLCVAACSGMTFPFVSWTILTASLHGYMLERGVVLLLRLAIRLLQERI